MMRNVLVPVEFSEEGRLVVAFCAGLSALGVERVVLGHVVEDSGMEGPVIARAVDDAREKLRDLAAPLEGSDLVVESRVATGDPSHEILALASTSHTDSIVVGTHAKTALSRLIRGSVSDELITNAEQPTMLVRFDLLRNAADPADLARAFAQTLILPTDFSASATRAVLWTLDLPSRVIGRLVILNVVDRGRARGTRQGAEAEATGRISGLCEMAEDAEVSARCSVRTGDAVQEILRELREIRGTGIITGSKGRGPFSEAVLGSVSGSLVRQASCPVVIVP